MYVGPSKIDGSNGKHIKDDLIVIHPDFDDENHANDIMLIKLEEPAPNNYRPFGYNFNPSFPSVGDDIQIIGFGMTAESGDYSDVLRQVDVIEFSQERCKETYKDLYPITPDFLCAGTEAGGRDACDSDSGAPLFVSNTVVGVTGDGIGCARAGIPSTNARVSSYAEWISKSICDNMSSVPPETCVSIVTKEAGGVGGLNVLFAVIVIAIGLWGGSIMIRPRDVAARLFRRQDTDGSYEEVPGVEQVSLERELSLH